MLPSICFVSLLFFSDNTLEIIDCTDFLYLLPPIYFSSSIIWLLCNHFIETTFSKFIKHSQCKSNKKKYFSQAITLGLSEPFGNMDLFVIPKNFPPWTHETWVMLSPLWSQLCIFSFLSITLRSFYSVLLFKFQSINFSILLFLIYTFNRI